jgi:hypothetical protein
MSDDKLFNDVYEVVWTNLGEHLFHTKIGENIRHTPLITIYKENEPHYEGKILEEEDIEFEKKWKIESSKAIQIAKKFTSHILSYPIYAKAFDIYSGNEDVKDEYKNFILKKTRNLKILSDLVELIELYNVDMELPTDPLDI